MPGQAFGVNVRLMTLWVAGIWTTVATISNKIDVAIRQTTN